MSAGREPLPGSAADYDGHADYLEEFRPPSPKQRVRRLCAGLLSIAVGLAVMRLVFNLIDGEPPILRILTGPAAFVVGVIAGAFYHSWLVPKKESAGERTGWTRELVGLGVFVFGFAIPVKLNADARAEAYRQSVEESQRAEAMRDALLKSRMDAGIEAMRADGRHAPPGVVPPGFEVEDRGMTVLVRNAGSLNTEISLSRVIEDASAPGGWRGCALYTKGPDGYGKYYHHYISPGMSLTFLMYSDCYAEFRDAPFEYRVGNPQLEGERGRQAWWSDSAMTKPDGREWEFWQRYRAPAN